MKKTLLFILLVLTLILVVACEPEVQHKHTWGDWISSKEATCTGDGLSIRKCTTCGEQDEETKVIKALGHSLSGKGTVTKEASCITKGEETFVCTRTGCSYKETKEIPATGAHSFSSEEKIKEATCTEDGNKTIKCDVCNYEKEETINKLGHSLSTTGTTTKEATCGNVGEETFACTRTGCDYKETKEIPATGKHTYEWKQNEAKDKHYQECKTCGNKTAEGEHSYGDWVIDTDSTEDAEGEKHRICSACNYTDESTISVKAHTHTVSTSYGHDETQHWKKCTKETCTEKLEIANHSAEETITKNATCTEDGKKTIKCKECGYEKEESINKLGHTWGDWTTSKEATCTEDGLSVRKCTSCEAQNEETKTIKAFGHSLNEPGTVTKEPNCVTAGEETFVCTRTGCSYKETKEITATGKHSFSDDEQIKEATCTEDGKKYKVCANCKAEGEITVIPATGHSYEWKQNEAKDKHYQECKTCKNKTDEGEHSYGNWVIDTDSTEDTEGKKHRICSACNYTDDATIPVKEHTHTASASYGYDETQHWKKCTKETCTEKIEIANHSTKETITKNATCTEDGKKTIKCEVCGYEKEETINKLEHSLSTTGTTTKEATCGTAGEETFACTRTGCDYKETKEIPATGEHSYGEWVVDTEATEDNVGQKHRVCSTCGDKEIATIPRTSDTHAASSSYEYDETQHWNTCTEEGCTEKWNEESHNIEAHSVEATCTKDGSQTYRCNVCGYETQTVIEKSGHSWGEWTEKTAGTCSVPAKQTRTCSKCLTIEERDGACVPENHTFSETYTVKSEGTCTTNEVRTYTCTGCGKKLDKEVENGKNHPKDKCELKFETDATPTILTPVQKREFCSACNEYTGKVEYEYASIEGYWVSDEIAVTSDGDLGNYYFSIGDDSTIIVDAVVTSKKPVMAQEFSSVYEWTVGDNGVRTAIATFNNYLIFSVTEDAEGYLHLSAGDSSSFKIKRISSAKHEHTLDKTTATKADTNGHLVNTTCSSSLHEEFLLYTAHTYDSETEKCICGQFKPFTIKLEAKPMTYTGSYVTYSDYSIDRDETFKPTETYVIYNATYSGITEWEATYADGTKKSYAVSSDSDAIKIEDGMTLSFTYTDRSTN